MATNTLTADLPSKREPNILYRQKGVLRGMIIIGTRLAGLPLKPPALIELAVTTRIARVRLRRQLLAMDSSVDKAQTTHVW
jgi:hypothetical protein